MSRIKIPETEKWMLDALKSMPDPDRAGEFNAPPEISEGAFLAGRF